MKNTPSGVYDVLKDRILNCAYEPGELIFEKDIVNELNVSRTPVREALNTLSGEGLIRIIPQKGVQIALISVKRTKQIYEIRKLLETYSISLAIRNLKEDDIAHLIELNTNFKDSLLKGNVNEIFKYGMDTHLQIANITCNDILCDILCLLREESYRCYSYYLKHYLEGISEKEKKNFVNATINNHKGLIESIVSKDETEAIKYLVLDLDNFIQTILKGLVTA